MRYKQDWEQAKEKWFNYWNHCNTGRPLMCVVARKPELEPSAVQIQKEYWGREGVLCQGGFHGLPEALGFTDLEDQYLNAEKIVARYRYFCDTHAFLGESFPNLNIDLGPGSLAAYLGCRLDFSPDTVWTSPCWDEEAMESAPPLKFDPENAWYRKHLQLAKDCVRLAEGDFPVDMPDMMANMDILAAMRGPSEVLMTLLEDPELVETRMDEISDAFCEYFDRFYRVIRDENGANAYTVFQIWGPGSTLTLHCDISAMISPGAFRQFAVPALRKVAKRYDHVLYHLDGKEAIRHLDAVLEIEDIDVLQWTSGNIAPDGTFPEWDEIYEKSLKAGKSIWVKVYTGEFEDWIRNTDRIVKKFGSHSLFLHFPEMSYEQGRELIRYAQENWSDIKGSIFG